MTFAGAETEKTVTLSSTKDTSDDDGESVKLEFGTMPAGAFAVNPTETTMYITDDDVPEVTVSFGATTHTAAEGGSMTVKVTLSDPLIERSWCP